jgi:membrane protein implicated in regulation of membrane protease activity
MTVLYWLFAAAAFLVLEMMTMGLTTIWFAGGALVGALAAVIGLPLAVQIGAFLVVSVVLLVLTRPLSQRYFNNRTVRTNVESLIGETCIVTQTIDNLKAEGQVQIKGQVWTARSVSDDTVLQKDTQVRVHEISGVKLIVEPVKEEVER